MFRHVGESDGAMAILKNIQMGKAANKLRSDFEHLWVTSNAYRPFPAETPEQRRGRRGAVDALFRLADACRSVGATAGDVNVLAVELIWAIDEERSYAKAFDSVMDMVVSGELRTVAGHQMRQFLSVEAVAAVLELAAVAARPEAFREYVAGPSVGWECEHDYARFEPDGDGERLVCETCGSVLDPCDYQDDADEDGTDPASNPEDTPVLPKTEVSEDEELAELEREVARLRAAKRRAELKAEIAGLRSELGIDADD